MVVSVLLRGNREPSEREDETVRWRRRVGTEAELVSRWAVQIFLHAARGAACSIHSA